MHPCYRNSSYAIGAQILGAKESFAQVWWESRGDGKCFPRNWGVIWSLSEQCGPQSNCFGLTRGKSSSSDTNTWKVSGEVFKAGHINPAAGGFVLMSRAREQGWWKLGRVEVKAPEESGRGKESANTSTLASIQRGTVESPERQLVYTGARFSVLLEIKVISGYNCMGSENAIQKIGW